MQASAPTMRVEMELRPFSDEICRPSECTGQPDPPPDDEEERRRRTL